MIGSQNPESSQKEYLCFLENVSGLCPETKLTQDFSGTGAAKTLQTPNSQSKDGTCINSIKI